MNKTDFGGNEPNKLLYVIEILYRYKLTIFLSFVIVVATVAFFTFRQEKIYGSGVSILVKDNNYVKNPFEPNFQRNIQNEIEVLKSQGMVEKVAENLAKRIYIDTVSKSETLIVVKEAMAASGTTDMDDPRFRGALGGQIRQAVNLESDKQTDIIRLSTTSRDPREAAVIADVYAEAYNDMDIDKSRSNAAQVARFLENQNKSVYEQLNQSEAQLKDYLEREANVVMGDASLLKQKVSNLQTQLEQNNIEYEQTRIALNSAKDQLNKLVPKASDKFSSVDDLYILELQKVIAKAEAERDISKIVSSDVASDPHYQDEYRKRNETIDNLRKVLNERTKAYIDKSLEGSAGQTGVNGGGSFNEIPNLTNQIMNYQYKLTTLEKTGQMLRENLNKYSYKLSQLPSQNLELDKLTREKEINEQQYLSLGQKYQEAVLAEKSSFGTIKILDQAGVSDTPIKPNVPMNLTLGSIFGLTLGVILAFIFNSIYNIVHSPKDIEYLGFRLLTSVPKLQIKQGEERKLLVEPETSSSSLNTKSAEIYESYLRLGLNLSYNKKLKSILITSAAPGAGKSSTAINLAITMANLGNKVLLVDTDLRKPVVNKYFDKPTSPGLTDYLLGQKDSEDIIQPTQFKGLDIITCGGRLLNPAFILTAPRMQNFTQTFGSLYDLVIFDSPPVNPVTDAIQLAKHVDEVVLVARADKTSAEALKNANKVLKQLGIIVGGVVLNDFDAAKAPFYTDYGRYSYYSDIEQDQAAKKGLPPVHDKSKKRRFFKAKA